MMLTWSNIVSVTPRSTPCVGRDESVHLGKIRSKSTLVGSPYLQKKLDPSKTPTYRKNAISLVKEDSNMLVNTRHALHGVDAPVVCL